MIGLVKVAIFLGQNILIKTGIHRMHKNTSTLRFVKQKGSKALCVEL